MARFSSGLGSSAAYGVRSILRSIGPASQKGAPSSRGLSPVACRTPFGCDLADRRDGVGLGQTPQMHGHGGTAQRSEQHRGPGSDSGVGVVEPAPRVHGAALVDLANDESQGVHRQLGVVPVDSGAQHLESVLLGTDGDGERVAPDLFLAVTNQRIRNANPILGRKVGRDSECIQSTRSIGIRPLFEAPIQELSSHSRDVYPRRAGGEVVERLADRFVHVFEPVGSG